MKLAKSYDTIAGSYDENADAFGLLTNSRFCALKQIENGLVKSHEDALKILDLGAGSGVFLTQLDRFYSEAKLTGLDISAQMLEIAKARLPHLETVVATVSEVNQHLAGRAFDLIVAHFVLAYVDLYTFIAHALPLLKPEGVISIVTTTHESFPFFQNGVDEKIKQNTWLGRILKRVRANGMSKTCTPTSYADIHQMVDKHGLEVLGHQQINTRVSFDSATEMTNFAVRGGWLLNASDYFWLPTSVFYQIVRFCFHQIFRFPLKDHHVVEVVLLRRKSDTI